MKMCKLKLGRFLSRRGGDSGQALVEAAIAAPVFFLLLMGAAELARVAYMAIEVANAARAGVQFASQNEKSIHDVNGITLAAKDDGYDVNNVSGITATPSTGYTCTDGTTSVTLDSDDLPACTSGATAVPTVTVTTSASFDPLIHVPGLPSSFTLSSSATETCVDCL